MNISNKTPEIEILAPAGNMDSLIAAIRCGANAVYLGGEHFSARQGAKNFDQEQLKEAVAYAHARGAQVHLAINTIVFDDELKTAELAIKEAAQAGVDAIIIQDLAVLELVKSCTKDIELHASTQMAVHNLEGVLQLAELGFNRAVLARELSLQEIENIAKNSPIDIECFVHGALCMSVSGQCYISSMIGGRSGNRGRCAQTCRLPFDSGESKNALSLKDLSVIEDIPKLNRVGVHSFKIEGRLKRPEYVAAAVTACRDVVEGREPDYETLQSIFSRSGFTQGYLEGKLGENMFGTRRREDVVSMSTSLKELAGLYYQENPLVPVNFYLEMKKDKPSSLKVSSRQTQVVVEGDVPEIAINLPTDYDRAKQSLEKTGNTPFYLNELQVDIEDGIMLPMSSLNSLRRKALDTLLAQLEKAVSKSFEPYRWIDYPPQQTVDNQRLRMRFSNIDQLGELARKTADEIVLPLDILLENAENLLDIKQKIIIEPPRFAFSPEAQANLKRDLEVALEKGFSKIIVSELGALHLSRTLGFELHGDFPLNVVNGVALKEYYKLGLSDITMSMEYALQYPESQAELPRGLVAYGKMPVMIFRNKPSGMKGDAAVLTDRLDIDFEVEKKQESYVLYNSVPTYWADQIKQLSEFDFLTYYFTNESAQQCEQIIAAYQKGKRYPEDFTRGLYTRRIE